MKKAAVLWTGGKDSCLALLLAHEMGYQIVTLATFEPFDAVEFKAHPQSEMRDQAIKLGIDIEFLKVAEPYMDSYIYNLRKLRDEFGISAVVTGDIDLVDGRPNWIVECCKDLSIEVVRPLWKLQRDTIMREIISRGIKARISLINHPLIPQTWLGKIIDEPFLEEMKTLSLTLGLDLAGENGEYHTMVNEMPTRFRQ